MKEKIDALKETFLLLTEWADRYNYLVELGESCFCQCCYTCRVSRHAF